MKLAQPMFFFEFRAFMRTIYPHPYVFAIEKIKEFLCNAMLMENRAIADMFEEIADMLSVDEDPRTRFEVRAYQKAAMTIGTMQEPIEDIYKNHGIDGLMKLPGIGKGLASHIEEYLKTGKIRKYVELKKKYPINMKQLTSIEGIGAKKAITLYKSLGIKNVDDLKNAIESHKISALEGFGEKSEELMKKGIALHEASKGRLLLGDALPVAENIVKKLKESGLVKDALIAGSARRWRETVGDLDILALSDNSSKVMDFFTSMPEVASTLVRGPAKTTVWLKIGVQSDLRVIAPESLPAALQYFTGSKNHNIEVRTIAVRKGYKLNEYGLFDSKNKSMPLKGERGTSTVSLECSTCLRKCAKREGRSSLRKSTRYLSLWSWEI